MVLLARKTVVVLGMLDSVHVGRWLEGFGNEPIDFLKDPSNAERNRQTIKEKASEEKVKAAALQYYR